jgi:hypothetical protein
MTKVDVGIRSIRGFDCKVTIERGRVSCGIDWE